MTGHDGRQAWERPPDVDARDAELFPPLLRARAFRWLWVLVALLLLLLVAAAVAYLRAVPSP